ncbi:MAG: ABC transporter ATP-binding protein [Bacteroidetes bacterium]|nr:ABC transporter ATP-binding protein [Bacteroidota bacterium]
MTKTILEAIDLRKVYKNKQNETVVIPAINISFKEGEFAIIMGNSGSGKSTLLYLLSGLDNPSGGQIKLDQIAIQQKSERDLALFRRDKIGFVFQQYNLIPNLTLLENVTLPGFLISKKKKDVILRAKKLLALLDIEPLKNRLPSQVSGGEQQRCCIARAIINSPKILLVDEPTGNLNSSASEKVLECLNTLHRQGQTISMVTHDLKSACRGNRILYLQDGQIIDELRFEKTSRSEREKESLLLNWLTEKGW